MVPTPSRQPDPSLHPEILYYCAQSEPLLLNSLTYQITLDPKHAQYADEYYGRSIALYRKTLMDTTRFQDDLAPLAGILLCSISVRRRPTPPLVEADRRQIHRARPWTIHLDGIAGILQEQGVLDTPPVGEWKELVSLMGVLDLPTHSLGRRGEHLHLWYKHCRNDNGIDESTGFPCSLLHLLASVLEPDVEDRLLQWPGWPGNSMTWITWDATRYAGAIMVREYRKQHDLPVNQDPQLVAMSVDRILSNLRELRTSIDRNTLSNSNSLLFPLVAAGSQAECLTSEDRAFIKECIIALSGDSLSNWPCYQAVLTTLETFWASNGQEALDQVTRDLGLELGLF
jgi:hypothetical protein